MKIEIKLGDETTEAEVNPGYGVRMRHPHLRMSVEAVVLEIDEPNKKLLVEGPDFREWITADRVRQVLDSQQIQYQQVMHRADMEKAAEIAKIVGEQGYANDETIEM